jgi:membrane-associated phospholipid phosphatase
MCKYLDLWIFHGIVHVVLRYIVEGVKMKIGTAIFLVLVFTNSGFAQEEHKAIERIGDIGQIVIPVFGWAMTVLHKDEKGFQQTLQSFTISMVVTHGMKWAIDRERPNGGEGSMPSGHTTAAFSGASFLQQRYGWKYGAPAYAAAAFVGYSRVKTNNHHTSDVLVGAAIGIVPNIFLTDRFKNVSVSPIVGRDKKGLQIAFSF